MTINFIFSKGNDKERVMHSKSENIEIMVNDKEDEVIEKLFLSIKFDWKHQCEVLILSLIVSIYCILNAIK